MSPKNPAMRCLRRLPAARLRVPTCRLPSANFGAICQRQSPRQREGLYNSLYTERLLAAEAKERVRSHTTAEALRNEAVAKVPAPAENDIVSVYNANRQTFGDKSLEDVRKEIVAFLRSNPEQKALQAYLDTIRTKHQMVVKELIRPR